MPPVVPGDGSGHEGGKDGSASLIDEIVREGARRMLAEALQAEVDAYIAQFASERDEHALVPQDPEGDRGAAAAVPARTVQRGLRARARTVPRLERGAVRADNHQVDRD